jgi:hypothetical protein
MELKNEKINPWLQNPNLDPERFLGKKNPGTVKRDA